MFFLWSQHLQAPSPWISCPDSLAATFLHASSMLFLSAPFGLFIIHLMLFSFPEDEKVPYALFLSILLQFGITGLALATAILYVSLAFFYYSSNTRLLGIGGIIMMGVMVTVTALHATFTTLHLVLHTLPVSLSHKRKISRKKDAENRPLGSGGISDTIQTVRPNEEPMKEQKKPVYCFSNLIRRIYESSVKPEMDDFHTMFSSYVTCLKSGDRISLYSFYLKYWSWERQKFSILIWILLEGSVTCAFIVLSVVELLRVPKACIRPNHQVWILEFWWRPLLPSTSAVKHRSYWTSKRSTVILEIAMISTYCDTLSLPHYQDLSADHQLGRSY